MRWSAWRWARQSEGVAVDSGERGHGERCAGLRGGVVMGICSSSNDNQPSRGGAKGARGRRMSTTAARTRQAFLRHQAGHPDVDYEINYKPDASYGRGMTGEVRPAKHKKTGVTYALKTLDKASVTPQEHEDNMNEIQLLKELDHPNIVRLHETWEDDVTVYLFFEVCSGGELFDRLTAHLDKFDTGFNESKVASIVTKMLRAIR